MGTVARERSSSRWVATGHRNLSQSNAIQPDGADFAAKFVGAMVVSGLGGTVPRSRFPMGIFVIFESLLCKMYLLINLINLCRQCVRIGYPIF